MQQLSPMQHGSSTLLLRRLNRVFGEVNIVLVAIAIGLAVLDFTCFLTLRASAEISRARTAPAFEASWPVIGGTPLRETAQDAFSSR